MTRARVGRSTGSRLRRRQRAAPGRSAPRRAAAHCSGRTSCSTSTSALPPQPSRAVRPRSSEPAPNCSGASDCAARAAAPMPALRFAGRSRSSSGSAAGRWPSALTASSRRRARPSRRRRPSAATNSPRRSFASASGWPRDGPTRRSRSELFISRKTVERHLSQIYRKLGIRSRTELARVLWPTAHPLERQRHVDPGLAGRDRSAHVGLHVVRVVHRSAEVDGELLLGAQQLLCRQAAGDRNDVPGPLALGVLEPQIRIRLTGVVTRGREACR